MHKHKRVPGEPETTIKGENTTMNKIIIIIFALLGALLLGIGLDLKMCSLIIPGFVMIIISFVFALSKNELIWNGKNRVFNKS